ncbi:recombinase RecA [Candidatus Peregrinibacteria bacterium]|jgi:recombination protein RecA|nr:recombinase RecA [Candidatus Peregrinibacteria bacterium]MBT3598370.1 recombinase RecA [Candidatus Peregrinibacteria bacterium]MBT4585530.1 recombinase RecA [Candidatus Peregrinibacteria bacterium]MBT6731345.1 recombinase RecA [Candidatus Peregrinibacteria bacterium]MBT7009690.1 recombinase RecA [Candidatus Peregrinibacteria bacterium]
MQHPSDKTVSPTSTTKKTQSNPATQDPKKAEAINTALEQIEKQYGVGAVMKMNDMHSANIGRFSSGSLSLDIALGGGIPEGRIIEIFGPESSGKTTLALHAIAENQKKGGRVAFIDAEHALDIQYAKKIGVDIDELLVSQPDNGEQALEITETLVRSGAIDVIVVDSVAALTPQAEIDGMMGDSHMGLQARLMSQALRKLTSVVSKANCTVIFINQIRMKIGVMFGNPETTTGGNALKFYSSLRLDVRRIDKILEKTSSADGNKDQDIVGNRTRVKVVKNKVAPPFRKAEFDILYAKGISKEGDLIDLGVKYGTLQRSGAYYRYGEDTIGQGREQARLFLIENKKIAQKIEKEIRKEAQI